MAVPTPSTTGYADVERLMAYWLTTVLGYPNVTHELPTNLRFVMPLIVVERFGGSDRLITVDDARIDVDVFGPDRDSARDHAYSIWQAMRTRLPRYRWGGAVVHRVDTISAPTHTQYDSKFQVRRFSSSFQLRIHKYTGV